MSDPVTLGTIIKAAIALSELLSQSDEERRQANWRSDTTAALARIEFKVDDILREILQLRLAFNEDLTRLYLNQRHALYAAFIQRLGTLTEKDTDEIRALITTPASGLLDSVTSFGKDRDSAQRPYYAGFSIAMRGLGALFIAANLISFERTRVLTVCQSLIDDFISLAVDPNATDSFASRAATERAFQQQQRDWLSAHAAGQIWLLGMRIVRRSRLGDSAESMSFVGVAITGTPEIGFHGSQVTPAGEPPPFPGVPAATDDPDVQRELLNRLVAIVNSEAAALRSSIQREAVLAEAIGGINKVRASLQAALLQG